VYRNAIAKWYTIVWNICAYIICIHYRRSSSKLGYVPHIVNPSLCEVYVRILDLKQEGGEFFIKDFRKYWRHGESQWRIKEKETKLANKQICFIMFPKNQPIVYAIQPVVFINI